MLAAGFASAGDPCRLITDPVNAQVVRATAAGAGLRDKVPINVVSMWSHGGDGGSPLGEVKPAWLAADPPIRHVIAIERCGPVREGPPEMRAVRT